MLNKNVVLKGLGYKYTPAKLNVYVRPAVRSVTTLVLKACFKFGTHVTNYTNVYHLIVFSWNPQILIFGTVFQYTTLP